VVEVALDRGAVSAGGYGAPICELELELKSGPPALLFELAQSLSAHSALQLSFLSKADRGYALVDGTTLEPIKALKPGLDPDATSEQAFRALAAASLAQITGNARVLRAARRPEAVHQLRVGLRRLRTVIGLFKPMLADDKREAIKAELRWIAGELDEARNLDVLITGAFRPAAERRKDQAGVAAFGACLLAAQTRAYDAVEAAVRSPRFHRLALDLVAWIETGGWTSDADDVRTALRRRPAHALAAEVLAKHHRKLVRGGRKLAELGPEQRHRLRIAAKKLRYAGDFFASLYRGEAARRLAGFTRTLSALQDGLGELNDIAVGAELIAGLAGAAPQGQAGDPDAARAFAAGQICADREAGAGAAMDAARKAHRRLRKATPYW
jgi:inorganic triphosphatase YgiF